MGEDGNMQYEMQLAQNGAEDAEATKEGAGNERVAANTHFESALFVIYSA